jgi:hypothetical protein
MTKEEILKIKEHIEIHAKREPRAIKITEIMRKAVDELERIAELEKENTELKENYRKRGDIITSLERQLRLNIHSDQLTKAKEIITNLV